MVKAIFSFLNELKNLRFSRTVKRTALSFSITMIILHLIFNLFLIALISYFLNQTTDSRLRHETEHIALAFHIENSLFIVDNPKELEETDLMGMTEDPFFVQIYSKDGRVLWGSPNTRKLNYLPKDKFNFSEKYHIENSNVDDYDLRVCYTKIYDEVTGEVFLMKVAAIDRVFDKVVYKIMIINIVTFPFVVGLVIFISLILIRRSFKPVHKIIEIANKITASNLRERITLDIVPNDELYSLKETLNSLFERLEEQIDRIAHFTDNASHQLMTPLTAIKSELEFMLRKDRTKDEYSEGLYMLKDQSTRMINIVKSMLILARQNTLRNQKQKIFNLSKMISREIIPLYKEHKNIVFDCPEDIYCTGSPEYISIIFYNLIDNAIKYSTGDSPINIKVEETLEWIRIVVEDHGIGISREDQKKIFERFFRSEKTENLGIYGFGLGLSLVHTLVKSLDGKIEIESEVDYGTKIIVLLPIVKMV